jgi:hypothetical protein
MTPPLAKASRDAVGTRIAKAKTKAKAKAMLRLLSGDLPDMREDFMMTSSVVS